MRIQLLLATNNPVCQNYFQQGLRFYQHLFRLEICTSIDELIERTFSFPYHLIIIDSELRISQKFPLLMSNKTILRGTLLVTVENENEILYWKQYIPDSDKIIVRSPKLMRQLPYQLQAIYQKEALIKTRARAKDESDEAKSARSDKKSFCLLDPKYRFISIHPDVSKNLGYSQEELLAMSLDDLIHPEQFISYQHWLAEGESDKKSRPFLTSLLSKKGIFLPVKLQYQPYVNYQGKLLNYQVEIQFLQETPRADLSKNGSVDQLKMLTDMSNIIRSGREQSLHAFLESIARTAANHFRFHRVTLALLDRRKGKFLKQIMLGYSQMNGGKEKIIEIPREVINKLFEQKYNVRVIYRNKQLDKFQIMPLQIEERRLQPREDENNWDPKNVIILNLADRNQHSFGYLSMDQPMGRFSPKRATFHNLELFSKLASLAVETYYHHASLEKRLRRLKRILLTGNFFKLSSTGSEIMNETVWSIRFSLDFQLVMLGMVNSRTNQLEIKTVSCHDHVKSLQLKDLSFPLRQLQFALDSGEIISKSIFIPRPAEIFQTMKNIYYDNKIHSNEPEGWNWWNLAVIPISGEGNKILGYIFVDDPADGRKPSREIIQTIEIFAQQLHIALNNRYLYLLEKKKYEFLRSKIANGNYNDKEKSKNWLKEILFSKRNV